MSTPTSPTIQTLLAQLPPGDPIAAGALAGRLGVNRMALSRLVAKAGDQVVRIGQTRSTAYAARQVTSAGSQWPLYRLRADATLEALGELHALTGDTFHFHANAVRPNLTRSPDGDVPAFFPGLPWYLDELRPQGFLGHTFAHRAARSLGVPNDLNRWQLSDTLLALVSAGGTQSGDLLLGGTAAQQAIQVLESPPDRMAVSERIREYPRRALAALEGEEVGSSPGGEQPKFTATLEQDGMRRAVLVKFAQQGAGDAAERWADLLVCEHLALDTLRAAGVAASATSLLTTDTHTFLEVERFDRTPDLLGRHGFVSLSALSSAFTGEASQEWTGAAGLLQVQGWLTTDTVADIGRLQAFGRLIGNTDMHQRNLGFHLVDSGPLSLAPAYDMLPMSLAPSRTGILRPASGLQPPAPTSSRDLVHLQWAAPLARQLWERVAGSNLIRSSTVRDLAAENARRVGVLGRQFGG